ncbi:MAG: DUF3592 domain-containing protein [Puniceicoccales bacterium]|nr:DUF3592 domain-containing protein [Puniceicoccales bacterium]
MMRLCAGSIPLIIFGAVIFCLGLPFLYVFFPWRVADEWRLLQSNTEQAEARILSAEKTIYWENKTLVWCYLFSFKNELGDEIYGKCYHTGEKWKNGDHAQVRYLPGSSQVVCLVDARLNTFSILAGLVIIVPAIGVVMIVFTLRSLSRRLYLVTRGRLGDFQVTAIKELNMNINKQSRYKITLQSLDGAISEPIVFKTHNPAEVRFAKNRYRRGKKAFAFFNPHKPKYVVLPEVWVL